jgi:hypothetical protein
MWKPLKKRRLELQLRELILRDNGISGKSWLAYFGARSRTMHADDVGRFFKAVPDGLKK